MDALPASGGDQASNLNIGALPEAFQHIVRSAYGDATGHIFLISAAIGIIGVVAALFLKPVTLRKSLDLTTTTEELVPTPPTLKGIRR